MTHIILAERDLDDIMSNISGTDENNYNHKHHGTDTGGYSLDEANYTKWSPNLH